MAAICLSLNMLNVLRKQRTFDGDSIDLNPDIARLYCANQWAFNLQRQRN